MLLSIELTISQGQKYWIKLSWSSSDNSAADNCCQYCPLLSVKFMLSAADDCYRSSELLGGTSSVPLYGPETLEATGNVADDN